MKITIDTKEDSPSEIKKVINMLSHLVGEQSYSNISSSETPSRNIFEDPDSFGQSSEPETPSNSSGGIFSMFGDNSTPATSSTETAQEEPEEETKEDIPEVIPY